MLRAYNQFRESITSAKELGILYTHLSEQLKFPVDLSDLLRMQWIYSVSALDKLVHELVRIGMLEIFSGSRPATAKFNSFSISYSTYGNMKIPIPPPQHWFEQEIIQKNKLLSFQDPKNISDALSYIWREEHKWQKIALFIGANENSIKTKLRNIVGRRNQMVHEADINPITNLRSQIDLLDTNDVIYFIESIGNALVSLV